MADHPFDDAEFEGVRRHVILNDGREQFLGLIARATPEEAWRQIQAMDVEALRRTLETKRATFWSRSRQEYWTKGETSGNFLDVSEVRLDCDGDTVLVTADPVGPTCHTGSRTCFDDGLL